MKPPRFSYYAPQTVAEAIDVLSEVDCFDAKLIAGGQSLVPMLNMRLARPASLLDVATIDGINEIRPDSSGAVHIGAGVTQATAMASPVVRERAPLVADALRWVGHPANRNRGTVGGSIAHADPAAELPAVGLVTGAVLVAEGPKGTREIAADEFFDSYYTTTLADDEILVDVRFPAPEMSVERRTAVEEVARRHGDFALVGATVCIDVLDGTVTEGRIALFGVADTPVRAQAAEQRLMGEILDPGSGLAGEVGQLAAADLTPAADVHASADYRREVAARLVARCIERISNEEGESA